MTDRAMTTEPAQPIHVCAAPAAEPVPPDDPLVLVREEDEDGVPNSRYVRRSSLTFAPAAEPVPLTLDAREPLAQAVVNALDVYGSMGNGEGWTLELDVIGTLWRALTPDEKARTGYDVAGMDARIEDGFARREGGAALARPEPSAQEVRGGFVAHSRSPLAPDLDIVP